MLGGMLGVMLCTLAEGAHEKATVSPVICSQRFIIRGMLSSRRSLNIRAARRQRSSTRRILVLEACCTDVGPLDVSRPSMRMSTRPTHMLMKSTANHPVR